MWNVSSDSSLVPLIVLVRERIPRESKSRGEKVKRERKSSSFSRRSLKAPFRAGEDREHAKQEDILMAIVEDDDVEVRLLA